MEIAEFTQIWWIRNWLQRIEVLDSRNGWIAVGLSLIEGWFGALNSIKPIKQQLQLIHPFPLINAFALYLLNLVGGLMAGFRNEWNLNCWRQQLKLNSVSSTANQNQPLNPLSYQFRRKFSRSIPENWPKWRQWRKIKLLISARNHPSFHYSYYSYCSNI